MKLRALFLWICTLILAILLALPVSADMGPKPTLEITVKHPPQGIYYLDLLVKRSPEQIDRQLLSKQAQQLDPAMIAALTSRIDEGWVPALTCHTSGPPIYGELTGENQVHRFGYIIPDEFCIAIVDSNGTLTISEPVRPGRFHARLTYDFTTQRITQLPLIFSYLLQFLSTCIPTLLIEAGILLLFGFSPVKCWKVFLLVNLITQIGLTVTMGAALIQNGLLLAYFFYIPAELLILLMETIAYLMLFKQFSPARKISYAITANIVSGGIGLFFIPVSYFLQTFL